MPWFPMTDEFERIFIVLGRFFFVLGGFIFIMICIQYYVPRKRRGNVIIGRTIGLIISAICANVYALVFNAVYHPHDIELLLVVFIVGFACNALIVGGMYSTQKD